MAETTADVRRDIELTRERMSTTLQQLESKLNVKQVVRDNPWPALAIAVGAGVLLSRSQTDVRAAAATVAATRGASSKVGSALDDVVANLIGGLHEAFESRITAMVNDLKTAIGAPVTRTGTPDGARAPAPSPGQPASSPVLADRLDVGARPADVLGGAQPQRAD
jgi:hypothetical protein